MSHSAEAAASTAVLATAAPSVQITVELASYARHVHLAGPAFTARGVAGDNLVLHRAVEAAPPGSIVVVELVGDQPAGHWGELLTLRARHRGIAGIVIDGPIRDVDEIARLGFAAFYRGTWPAPATKRHPGELGIAAHVAGLEVATGDLVVADGDGLVVVRGEDAGEAMASASALAGREAMLAAGLLDGARLCDLLGMALLVDGEGAE